MINKIIELLNKNYKLVKADIGEDGIFSAAGMKFNTTHYEDENFGSVSLMEAKGFLGAMQMKSVIINPFNVDAPLFSYDCIKVLGNSTVYLEMFDTTLNHCFDISEMESLAKDNSIPEVEFKPNWYDNLRYGTPQCRKVKKSELETFNKWAEEYVNAYLQSCKKSPVCDETEKRHAAAVYSDGLLRNGGPATDPVKKALGDEKAAYFFRHTLFATEK